MRRLNAFLGELELSVAKRAEAMAKFDAYYELLKRWNRSCNLVAKRDLHDVGRFETRHLIDSVALYPWMRGTHVDVGSGGGLPAIPLAILRPGERTILVERSTKKCRFLRHVGFELELDFEVIEGDAKEAAVSADVITARAVAPVVELWPLVRDLMADDGVLLLQTGEPVDPGVIDAMLEQSREIGSRFVTLVKQPS